MKRVVNSAPTLWFTCDLTTQTLSLLLWLLFLLYELQMLYDTSNVLFVTLRQLVVDTARCFRSDEESVSRER